ncbi:MAG: CvpA family protein, partial [Clostridia bacterium]|nr:CvpA family protein [Clostridia bacterium]
MMTPDLLSTLVWLPFLLLAVILGTVFAILGFKRGSVKAGISVGVTALSTLLSVLLARALSSAVATPFHPMIADLLGGELYEGEYASVLLHGVTSAVAALVLFIPCFLLLLLLFKNLTSLVFTARIPKAKHVGNKLGGMAIGLLDALLVSFLILLPAYGTLHLGGNLLTTVTVLEEETEGETDASYTEWADALCSHPLADVAGFPLFTATYDSMASFSYGGETVSLSKTVNTASETVTAVFSYLNGEVGSKEGMLVALNSMEKLLTESDFFSGIAYDLMGDNLEEEELVGDYYGFSDITVLQNDISALFTVLRSTVRNDILPVLLEKEPDFSQIELGSLPYDLAEALNSTASLAALKADLINALIDEALEGAAGDDEAKQKELRAIIGTVKKDPLTGDDLKAEGDSLYLLLTAAIRRAANTDSTAADAELAGTLIEGLARHPAFGADTVVEVADLLLGLSEQNNEAGTAVKDTLKDVLNASLTKPVKDATFGKFVGTTATAADAVTKLQNGEADAEAVESLLDASPEVLEQVETVVNDELLSALGIEQEQAAGVAPLVNTLFSTIRETELTAEEKSAEAEALSGALACVFTVTEADNVSDTVSEMVDYYLDSKLLGTMAEKLTAEG